jgi:hypothetical protein
MLGDDVTCVRICVCVLQRATCLELGTPSAPVKRIPSEYEERGGKVKLPVRSATAFGNGAWDKRIP